MIVSFKTLAKELDNERHNSFVRIIKRTNLIDVIDKIEEKP